MPCLEQRHLQGAVVGARRAARALGCVRSCARGPHVHRGRSVTGCPVSGPVATLHAGVGRPPGRAATSRRPALARLRRALVAVGGQHLLSMGWGHAKPAACAAGAGAWRKQNVPACPVRLPGARGGWRRVGCAAPSDRQQGRKPGPGRRLARLPRSLTMQALCKEPALVPASHPRRPSAPVSASVSSSLGGGEQI